MSSSNLGFRMQIIPSFILQISVILANLFSKNYTNDIFRVIEKNHLDARTIMYDLCFITNGTILLYFMILPPRVS